MSNNGVKGQNQRRTEFDRFRTDLYIFQYRSSRSQSKTEKTEKQSQEKMGALAKLQNRFRGGVNFNSTGKQSGQGKDSDRREEVLRNSNINRLQALLKSSRREQPVGESSCQKIYKWISTFQQKVQKMMKMECLQKIRKYYNQKKERKSPKEKKESIIGQKQKQQFVGSTVQWNNIQILRGSKGFQIGEELLVLVESPEQTNIDKQERNKINFIYQQEEKTHKKLSNNLFIKEKKGSQITNKFSSSNKAQKYKQLQSNYFQQPQQIASKPQSKQQKIQAQLKPQIKISTDFSKKRIQDMVQPHKFTQSKLQLTLNNHTRNPHSPHQQLISYVNNQDYPSFALKQQQADVTIRKNRLMHEDEDTYKLSSVVQKGMKDRKLVKKIQNGQEDVRKDRYNQIVKEGMFQKMAKEIYERRMKRSRSQSFITAKGEPLIHQDKLMQSNKQSPQVSEVTSRLILRKRCNSLPKITFTYKSRQQCHKSHKNIPAPALISNQMTQIVEICSNMAANIQNPYYQQTADIKSPIKMNDYIKIVDNLQDNNYCIPNIHSVLKSNRAHINFKEENQKKMEQKEKIQKSVNKLINNGKVQINSQERMRPTLNKQITNSKLSNFSQLLRKSQNSHKQCLVSQRSPAGQTKTNSPSSKQHLIRI